MQDYIYIMRCQSLPHMVKIGYSNDPKERATELSSSSSIPSKFEVYKTWPAPQARKTEAEIHRQLRFCRITSNKEFFGLSAEKAAAAVAQILEARVFDRASALDSTGEAIPVLRMHDSKELGACIKQARKKLGMTQAEVALTAGTGVRVIGEIEAGKSTAQVGITFRILRTLGIQSFCSTAD